MERTTLCNDIWLDLFSKKKRLQVIAATFIYFLLSAAKISHQSETLLTRDQLIDHLSMAIGVIRSSNICLWQVSSADSLFLFTIRLEELHVKIVCFSFDDVYCCCILQRMSVVMKMLAYVSSSCVQDPVQRCPAKFPPYVDEFGSANAHSSAKFLFLLNCRNKIDKDGALKFRSLSTNKPHENFVLSAIILRSYNMTENSSLNRSEFTSERRGRGSIRLHEERHLKN